MSWLETKRSQTPPMPSYLHLHLLARAASTDGRYTEYCPSAHTNLKASGAWHAAHNAKVMLIAAITEPIPPGTCAYTLAGYFIHIVSLAEDTNTLYDCFIDLQLLDAFMTFLCISRSLHAMVDLEGTIARQPVFSTDHLSTPTFEKTMHRMAEKVCAATMAHSQHSTSTKLLYLVSHMLEAVSYALSQPIIVDGSASLYKPKRRRAKARRADRGVLWPQRMQQLVPCGGAKQSVRNLLWWLDYERKSLCPPASSCLRGQMVTFVSALVKGTGQLVVPFIVSSTIFYDAMATWDLAERRVYDTKSQHLRGCIAKTCLHSLQAHWQFLCDFWEKSSEAQLMHFLKLGRAPYLHPEELIMSAHSWMGRVTNLSRQNSQATDHVNLTYLKIGETSVLWLSSQQQRRNLPSTALDHPDQRLVENANSFRTLCQSSVGAAFYTLLRLSRSWTCASPDCQTLFASEERKFKFCGRCGRAAYCSETCQRASWADATLPPKAVCKQICLVVDIGKLHRAPNDPDIAPFISAISDWHCGRVGKLSRLTQACQEISSHFSSLSRVKWESKISLLKAGKSRSKLTTVRCRRNTFVRVVESQPKLSPSNTFG